MLMGGEVDGLAKQVRFPEYSDEDPIIKSTKSRLQKLTFRLREAYYKAAPKRDIVYARPFGGPIGDSIGPWPEFILRGLPCQKSIQGCCTPCFYSRLPQVDRPVEEVYQSLVDQVAYILNNFGLLVAKEEQQGPVAWQHPELGAPLAFVLTPTGSFFDEQEFPLRIRNEILRMLLQHSDNCGRPYALHIETHAEHLVAACGNHAGFQETTQLLQKLNCRLLFGYESSSSFVRNVLYNKYLGEGVFQDAVKRARKAGLDVGAFVFVGTNPLNDIEILSDAFNTIDSLAQGQISPVVMFHNVQPYTIQELLFLYHAHTLPEPRTILEVVRHLVTTIPDHREAPIDPWLIADPVGGPPAPKYSAFSSGRKSVTCDECAKQIYGGLVQLRTTRAVGAFLELYERLSGCPKCAPAYLELLATQLKATRLEDRLVSMMDVAEKRADDYISVVRPLANEVEEFAVFQDSVPGAPEETDTATANLKAELLCYGIRIDPEIRQDVLKFNSYIHEAGFAHAAHFMIGSHLVNACVAESFCSESPFLLKRGGNAQCELTKKGIGVGPCSILATPAWCDQVLSGYKLGDVLRPHSPNVISGMPNPVCCYFNNHEECAFCSLGPYQEKGLVPAEVVAKAAIIAQGYNPDYELALSGGTSDTPDRSASYFANIARGVTSQTRMPISVELVPPRDKVFLRDLREAGASAVIMNIEIWDPNLRSVYCPGKSKITLEEHMEAIEYGVELFGRGRVASVLIAGLQSPSEVIEGAQALISRGAIPTIIPFKPFDACKMAKAPITDPVEVTSIHAQVSRLLTDAGLGPTQQPGCTRCGGCSLENLQSRGDLK